MNGTVNLYGAAGGTLSMIPGAVVDEVQRLSKLIETFQDLTNAYMKTNQKLETWNSPNKVALEQRIEASKPAFEEAFSVITSYKNVAGNSVALISQKLMA